MRPANPAAFLEQLFRAFYAPPGSVVHRVVPDRAAVEDILQDVFLRVWQGLAALPALDSHRAYLTRMALNAAVRHQQRGPRQVAWHDAAPPDLAPVAPDALADLHAAEASAAVAAALAQLPPQCRIGFELSRYEELSYQQIAEALEISPKTVENQMGKALRILRRGRAPQPIRAAGLRAGQLPFQSPKCLSPTTTLLVDVLVSHPPAAGVGALPTPVRPGRAAYLTGPRGGSAPGAYLLLPGAACPVPTLP